MVAISMVIILMVLVRLVLYSARLFMWIMFISVCLYQGLNIPHWILCGIRYYKATSVLRMGCCFWLKY